MTNQGRESRTASLRLNSLKTTHALKLQHSVLIRIGTLGHVQVNT
jgi:hypothetical protein